LAVPPAESVYAQAATHTGFRALMSNETAAVSLVNAVLTAMIPRFQPIARLERDETPIEPMAGYRIPVEFHGKAAGDRHVIIDLQARVEDYFYRETVMAAASAVLYAVHRRGGRDGERPAGKSTGLVTDKVYVIQLINYDLMKLPREVRPDPDFMVPFGISVKRIEGIQLVQIELPRFRMRFPVADAVASGWRAFEWWLYLLQFSDRFADGELERYQACEILEELCCGLESLKPQFWAEEVQGDYRAEVRRGVPDYGALRKSIVEAENAGRLRGSVEGLIKVFLRLNRLEEFVVREAPREVTGALVREIWEKIDDPRKTDDLYRPFICALRANHVMVR
jgi:hypothetical protein